MINGLMTDQNQTQYLRMQQIHKSDGVGDLETLSTFTEKIC